MAVSAAAEKQTGRLNERISWALEDSVLTISGEGRMPSFNTTNIEKLPWQNEKFAAGVAVIVIGEGITEVGAYNFGSRIHVHNVRDAKKHTYYNTQDATTSELFVNIREVVLPSTLKKISHHAFARMPLSHIAFPDGLEEIAAGAFTNTALQCVILPAGIRKVGNEAFCGCQNLRAIDFNNAAIVLSGGMLFDAERLRMLLHTSKIKGVASTTFNATALEGVEEAYLLDMFRTDGVSYYLETYVPSRASFKGSDEEYAQTYNAALDLFYEKEAKNATSLFALDRLELMPYDPASGTCRVKTVHNGEWILPVTAEQASLLADNWPEIREKASPVFRPDNGKVELQTVNFAIGDTVVVAAKL